MNSPESVHILHNHCLLCIMTTKASDCKYDLRIKCQGKIYLKFVCIRGRNTNLIHFLMKGVNI